MYYIYCITNNINGKTYIGQRKCSKDKIPEKDVKYMGSGKILRLAYKKYGIENFSKSILAIAETKEDINFLEKEFIASYRLEGKAEYNVANGGDGGDTYSCLSDDEKKICDEKKSKNNHWLGKHLPDEMKIKISEGNKGKIISKEQIELIRKAHLGKSLSKEHKEKLSVVRKGHVVTQETRDKLSKSLKGRSLSEEHIEKLRQSRLGNKLSIETREKLSKLRKGRVVSDDTRRKLSELCKGKGHSQNQETREKISKSMIGVRAKHILCVELNVIYPSLTFVSRKLGITQSRISECCNGKRELAGGYHWRYVKDEDLSKFGVQV